MIFFVCACAVQALLICNVAEIDLLTFIAGLVLLLLVQAVVHASEVKLTEAGELDAELSNAVVRAVAAADEPAELSAMTPIVVWRANFDRELRRELRVDSGPVVYQPSLQAIRSASLYADASTAAFYAQPRRPRPRAWWTLV